METVHGDDIIKIISEINKSLILDGGYEVKVNDKVIVKRVLKSEKIKYGKPIKFNKQ